MSISGKIERKISSKISSKGVINRFKTWADDYYLYINPRNSVLRDLVSRDALTTTIPAARTLDGVTFAANTPAIVDGRLRGVPVVQNLITSPNDMTGAGWVADARMTVLSATTMQASAQYGTRLQNIGTLAGVLYTFSFIGSISSGGPTSNYALYHSGSATGSATEFTLSTTPTKKVISFLGKIGGGILGIGVQDRNASGWGVITATNFQLTTSTYPLPLNVSGSATVTEAGTSTLALTDGMSEGLGEAASGTLVTEWTPKFNRDDLIGPDIPRTLVATSGTPTITGSQVEFADEASGVRQLSYWTAGKKYKVNHTISSYVGTGSIVPPYSGTKFVDTSGTSITKSANGTYEYNYVPTDANLNIYSNAGHTATVTINSIKELKDCTIAQSGNLRLWYNADGYLRLTDGTNTATVAYTAVNGTAVWIHGDYDWKTNTMRVGYSTTETGTITWGTATYFASTFVPSTLQPLTGSEYQMLGKTYISKGDTAIFNRGTNDIGIPGGIGFGVGTYPGTLPTGYSELTGTTTIGHDNYGNYQFRDGSIVCWIPAHYVKIGTGSNGPYVNKISVVKYSAFASEAAANAVGYFLPRSFKDGGINKPGYFVDKYQCSKNALGTGYVASSIPLGNPISTAADHNPIGDLTATAGANYYYSAITAAKARDGENGAVSATPKWFATSRFIYADLAMLSVAHGQAARSATYCAWYDATGAKNYPKGNNNNALADTDDTSVTFTHDGYASGNCAKTGSGSPFAKTTHNGQNCGVTDLNGNLYEVSTGFTCIATSKTITAVTLANPCQITAASHGRVTGDYVMITSVGGATQLNDKIYLITKVDDNNFTLQGVDSSAFGTFTTGGAATFGDWYAAKESVAMKDFTSGSTGATDHWGAVGVAAMMDEFIPAFETAYPSNGFVQRYGSGANQVLSEAIGSTLTALGLPKDAAAIDTTGTNLFGKDYYYQYIRNELCAVSGGYWNNSSAAGVWHLTWNGGRASSNSYVGFRCASYGD